MQLTFLGTGTSIGVPVIGCDCPVCTSDDPKNKRSRSSIHVHTPDLQFVVDTGPDFRSQCLREKIRHLDAALFTHQHTDHIMGFDDLRRFTVGPDSYLPIFGPQSVIDFLHLAFEFAFNGRNQYWGYLKPRPHAVHGPFRLGRFRVVPLPVDHGKVETIGYLFTDEGRKKLAYIPDAKTLRPESMEAIHGVETLVIDALRERAHATHLSVAESLEISQAARARRTFFTHFSCEVDYTRVEPTLPDNVRLAYDGLKLDL